MNPPRFEISQGKNKQWYFVLKAKNGKVICQSEGYKQRRGAVNGCMAIAEIALDAIILYK